MTPLLFEAVVIGHYSFPEKKIKEKKSTTVQVLAGNAFRASISKKNGKLAIKKKNIKKMMMKTCMATMTNRKLSIRTCFCSFHHS